MLGAITRRVLWGAAMDGTRAAHIAQRKWIDDKRVELGPTEVRLHHIPQWFSVAVRQAQREGAIIRLMPPLSHVCNYDSFWDHWGSTVRTDGRHSFCSEPYHVDAKDRAFCHALAAQIGCWIEFSGNSWWYPTRTERVEFIRTPATLIRRNPKVPCVLMGGPMDGKLVSVGRQELELDRLLCRHGKYRVASTGPNYFTAQIENNRATARWIPFTDN